LPGVGPVLALTTSVLNSVVEYTTIPVYPDEVVIGADSTELLAFPFLFMTGDALVRFRRNERDAIVHFVEQGGLLLSDDCNHDVNGLYARSFEQEMRILFGARGGLRRLPNDHALYRAFFQLPDGPLATSHELNGWGDDLVHDYLQGVEHAGRLGVVYSNVCHRDRRARTQRVARAGAGPLATCPSRRVFVASRLSGRWETGAVPAPPSGTLPSSAPP
jgi:hypothetical protein